MILTMKYLNSSKKREKRNLPELIDAFVFRLVEILDVKKTGIRVKHNTTEDYWNRDVMWTIGKNTSRNKLCVLFSLKLTCRHRKKGYKRGWQQLPALSCSNTLTPGQY